MKSDEAIKKQEFADTLPRASIKDLGMILMGDGFEVRITSLLFNFFFYMRLLIVLV